MTIDDIVVQVAAVIVQEQARNIDAMRAAGLDADAIATADAFAAQYHAELLVSVRAQMLAAAVMFDSTTDAVTLD